jgi:hypothetical protein
VVGTVILDELYKPFLFPHQYLNINLVEVEFANQCWLLSAINDFGWGLFCGFGGFAFALGLALLHINTVFINI